MRGNVHVFEWAITFTFDRNSSTSKITTLGELEKYSVGFT